MNKFESVKKAANDLGLTSESLTKTLRLFNYAKDQGVEMYLEEGKLRMREVKVDKNKKSDNLGDIFSQFGDIFNGKKKA
jgi:16S rRNA C1402 N4-methylase RsmH